MVALCRVRVQANIHSIMGSEDQVMELMILLDTGLNQANKIEEKLSEYEQKLQVCLF
jgi:exocyst complex component 1